MFVVSFIDPHIIGYTLIATIIFNYFNFRNRAKCFAGDAGSISIAFIILFILGKLILETGDPGYIILLAVYGIDSILTILHRVILEENITLPHRKHAYQLLANELKMNHINVSLLYMIIQATITIGYLVFYEYRYIYFILAILILMAGYIFFIKKHFHLHQKNVI